MKNLVVAAAVCVGVMGAGIASAAPLSGTFEINGGPGNPARVGASWLDFAPFNYPAPGTGVFVTTGGTGSFNFASPVSGTIGDLFALGVGPVVVPNWLEFAGHSEGDPADWDFTITNIRPGVGSFPCDATIQTPEIPCTPPGSPFTLTNIREAGGGFPAATTVSMTVTGFVLNAAAERSIFSLTFTSQLDNLSALGAFQAVIPDDEFHFVQSSWSAEGTVIPDVTVNPTIPEPASLVLMSLAMSGAAIVVRRRKSGQAK
jgi:hypothetical protein